MANEETRKEILATAEDLIYKKGLQSMTISEIAARASVADSVIYHYFKGKEDLVFSIAGDHFREAILGLQEHLEGIVDPTSRLSKMIWFHLHYNQTHENYPRIWLFECRSNRNFYRHSAYQVVRKYSGIPLAILADGVDQGVFRADVNMRVVRDLIMGALDFETLQTLSEPNAKHRFSDVHEIMDLVSPMIETRYVKPKKDVDKSMRIIAAAEKLFSEKGYQQSSIAEIARLADVAEGTVYDYFKNKEDLLFSIPRERFGEHVDSLTEVFQIKTPLKKLTRFIQHHFFLYLTKPEFLKTFLLDLQLNPRFYGTEAVEIFRGYCSIVDEILEEGKRDGSFRPSVNQEVFRNLLFGGFSHVGLRWLILNRDSKTDRLAEMDEIVSLLVRTVNNG
jgi:TetR/AcrR family fatty acid metabolism transcriptional regulator